MSEPYPTYPVEPMTPADQRLWATLIHVGSLFLGVLSPLVGYLALRDRGEFVRAHAVTALNFQITAILALFAAGLLSFVVIGLVLLPIIGVLMLVLPILAAVAANSGQVYRYPLTLNLVH